MPKELDFRAIQKLMRSKKKSPQKKITYLLEQTSPEAIREAKKYSERLLDYHWKYYYELAKQREEILDLIKESLVRNADEKYIFPKWQRAVKWEYSNHPMCTIGSQTFVGQRFNYGDEINSQISGFSCLYLAVDKDTAIQETLGQSALPQGGLTSQEIALSNSQSETFVSISGCLDHVFDLRDSKKMKDFVRLIGTFKLSKEVQALASALGDEPGVIVDHQTLQETLLEPSWRDRPVQYQVPSNSQIFGQLVYLSGIQGILYPSKLTGKDCLAIFVQNFKDSTCYLEFDDTPPDERIPTKVDQSNFDSTSKKYRQLVGH